MKDEYLVELEEQISSEIIRCGKIRDILLIEEKVIKNKNNILRYLYALKILFLIKQTGISITMDEPEMWNQEIISQLNDSSKHLEELCMKMTMYTKKRTI